MHQRFLLILSLLLCSLCSFCQPTDGQKGNFWAIDMTHLEVNGKHYAVWSGWDGAYEYSEAPTQNLYIAEMTFHDEKPLVRLGKRSLLSFPEMPWELKVNEHISLQEGPSALYHGDDVFILYSTRGSWTRFYKLGALRLKNRNADPLDPDSWTKLPRPVFQGEKIAEPGRAIYGVGHASFVLSPDNSEHWIYFHAKTLTKPGWGDRKAFLQKFTFDKEGNPSFGDPADPSLPMKRPSGEMDVEIADGHLDAPEEFNNPIHPGADPWMFKHGDKYYTCFSAGGHIWVTESRYMTKFENTTRRRDKAVVVWTLPPFESNRWNITSLWAPEIHFIEGKWYIFYTAGQQPKGPFWSQRAGVLVSEKGPMGPYVESDDKPLFTGER